MGLTHLPLWIKIITPTFIATMAKNNKAPLKKTNFGKSASKTPKKKKLCPRSLVHWWSSCLRCFPSLPRCPLDRQRTFFLASLPLSLSAVSKMSSVLSTTSNIKKRLVLDEDDNRAHTKPKYQEQKLAAYDVDWFDLSATKNKCIKHTSIKNLPDTQEGQLTFLLGKFETSEIKTAFADAIRQSRQTSKNGFLPTSLS